MSSSFSIPTLAIVGHPNEGKSSVVATLAEDDQVRISAFPGETVASRAYPVRLDGRELLRFIDTPGFQHPQRMLEWMRARAEDVGSLAGAFIQAHRGQAAFVQDLELLQPLAQGAGILYVVDGSRPVRQHDLAEMEILRLTGNPRLALINPKEDEAAYLEDWKLACARAFSTTRMFNAVQATYAERIDLLESLKAIHQDWAPALDRAIRAFRDDWTRRLARVAEVLCDLLREALLRQETKKVFKPAEEEEAKVVLLARYQRAIAAMEDRAQDELRHLFKHHLFHPSLPGPSILREELFTEKTWQLLGLNRKQLVLAAALLGAGAGVKLDLVFAHLTFGVFTASGAALAAATAWLQGENMARVRVQRLRLGGIHLGVGPHRNPQFAFVLLDRMLLFVHHMIHWTHARRDPPPPLNLSDDPAKLGFVSSWNRDRRQTVLQFMKRLSRANRAKQDEAERALARMLREVLDEMAGS